MPSKRAEKARKTRKVNSKEGRDSSTQIATRNLRSVGLRDGSHNTSEACDAAEGPEVQHVENEDIDPVLSTLEIDNNYTHSSGALQIHTEDYGTPGVLLPGNFKPALNCTDMARYSSNGKLVMECTQALEGAPTFFQNEYFEDRNVDVSYNIMRKGDESNTIEYMNNDVSYNITRKGDESNTIEYMNNDVSYNITRKGDESNTIEYMNNDVSYNITREREEDNTDENMNVGALQDENNTIEYMDTRVPCITRKQEKDYIIEGVDEKFNGDFPNQSHSCLKLQQDNVCEVLKQKEHAASETSMPFSITAGSNGANIVTANKRIEENPATIIAVVTVNRLKSCSQDIILQSKYDKPIFQENTTTKRIEDITSVFLSQTKQSSFECFGSSLGNNTTQASTKSRSLKRKDKHLFSSQPQSKRFKSPKTMTTSDYTTTDSAQYQMKDVGTHTTLIQDEGICDSVAVVDSETLHRNMDSEDMPPCSTAISQVKSCTGYTMEKGENGSSVTNDEDNKIVDHLATTQYWYLDCAKVNEEITLSNLHNHNRVHEGLSLSNFHDHNKVNEELSFSDLPDPAKVDEELILPQHPDHAKVQENVNLVTKSEISEPENAVWMKDSMKDIASRSEIKSDMQQNLGEAADCKNNQMLISSFPLQIQQDVMCDDQHKDKAVNITTLINSSMGDKKKLNQNSVVSNGDKCTVEASDSECALTCIEGSVVTNSTRCTTAVLDHPRKATVFTHLQTNSFVNEPFNDLTTGFSNSVMKHDDKEKHTSTTTQEFIMNTPNCPMSKSHGNYMENCHNNEKEDLAYMGTQEFTINDVINDSISKEGIENAQLTQSSFVTEFTKEGKLSKEESINKATVNLDCKLDPNLASFCGKMKEGNSWETCQKQTFYSSEHFNTEDTFNGNGWADVNKPTTSHKGDTFNGNNCADVNKPTTSHKGDTFNGNNCADVNKLITSHNENTFNGNNCADVNKLTTSHKEDTFNGNDCADVNKLTTSDKEDTFNGNNCADVDKLTTSDKEDTFNGNNCADVNKLTTSHKEDTFNGNNCADVDKLTTSDKGDTFNGNNCADVNKPTTSDPVKTHGGKLYLEVPEMYAQGISNQIQGMSSYKNGEDRERVNSHLHTETITANSLQDVFDSTKYHSLPLRAQTVCDQNQHRHQSDGRLDQDDTHLESCSLIVKNHTNQICIKQPHLLKQINDSIKEYNTSSKSIAAPLSSSHNTNAREIQLNRNSGCIQKDSLKLSVINKDINQNTEGSQLGNSDCFQGILKCADVFPNIPANITGANSSITKQNATSLDNNDCQTHLKSINDKLCSDTKTTLSLLRSNKTDLNMVTGTSEQRSLCLPSTSEKYLGNCQEVFDNLDCYSLSDLEETSGKPSKCIFNNHKEDTQIIAAAQSLSEHKGTLSQSTNCLGSVSQGIFCAPQKNPQLNYEDTKSSFLNRSVSGINEMHKTLQKLSTMDSAIYLSDSQICSLASEDFEQAFNSNETEDIDRVDDVHQDKFEQSFSSAQARSVREIQQRKAEGKKLVDGVIADLVSVNKQLLKMKSEMESVKRVVQQQKNKPHTSFPGKREFGFRYQN